jgi:hypothetical protein
MDDVTTADLLARMEAMAARLDGQASEIEGLRAENVAQAREIARLTPQASALGAAAATGEPGRTTTRRGLLRGALAAGAAATALAVAQATPAQAGTDGDVILGGNNNYTGATTFVVNGSTTAPSFAGYSRKIGVEGVGQRGGVGIRGSSSDGDGPDLNGAGNGVEGRSRTGNGVEGRSGFGNGIYGRSENGNGIGVRGESGTYVGVAGYGNSYVGVLGNGSSAGVRGEAPTGNGVLGIASGSGDGVQGRSGSGSGVRGISTSGVGIYGTSTSSVGVLAVSVSGYAMQVSSQSNYGFVAAGTPFAGVFAGNLYVQGSMTVASGAKSAAVKKRDGSMARVYCQESPEPWFEDFGTATLTGGQAVVDLDPEFDEVVKGDDYRVFLTAIGNTGFLFVSRKGPHRFEVRSEKGASATGSFDYRVVARRLDDVGKRLEKIDVPDIAKAQANLKARAPQPNKSAP